MIFSIIIPAFNEEAFLPGCLKSIREMDFPVNGYEIIVVDNGSTDTTRDIARSFGAVVLRNDSMNVSGLRNLGAQSAKGQILAFVDADCVVDRGWLRNATKYIDQKDVCAWGCPPFIPENATWVQRTWFLVRRKIERVQTVDWLESMNLFVRSDIFSELNGFNEKLVTCEDVDLSYRLTSFGKIVSDEAIQVIHFGEARTLREFINKEIWRGHSNLRGVFSHGLTLKELPSLAVPVCFGIVVPLLYLIALMTSNPAYFVIAFALIVMPSILVYLKIRKKKLSIQNLFHLFILMQFYYVARVLAILK